MDDALWAEIRRLYFREGLSMRKIAARLGINRRTVARAVKSEKMSRRKVCNRQTKVNPYKGLINNLLEKYPEITAIRIFEEVCNAGYCGGYTILKDYIRKIRDKRKEPFLKIETLPGEQAQVDWADCGKVLVEGVIRRVYCFTMILSWSRYLYFEFSLSCKTEDFIEAHINAFHFFGGVPCKILYDNLKSVVLHRIGNQIKFNPRFMDYVGVYLFEPVVARLYRGSDKGKVENSIKYIKGNFLNGRSFKDFTDMVLQGAKWRDDTANTRIHGTTRERPIDRFQIEKAKLNSLPDKPYKVFITIACKVNPNCRVKFDTNSYTVPHRYVGRAVILKATKQEVFIYYKDKLIATHRRSYGKYKDIEDSGHMKELLKYKKRAIRSKVIDEFRGLGKEAELYLEGLVEKANNLWVEIAKILKLRHLYGKTELIGAINKALSYKAFGASYIENIIITSRRQRGEPIIVTDITVPEKFKDIEVEERDPSIYDILIKKEEEEDNE
jgi:transposase